jgi:sporulation protein YlmC with PRC-barrel domain
MRFSEAHHKQVVATSTASRAGRVEGFVVTPKPGWISALRLGKVEGHGSLLGWSDLKAFGHDAVTVESPEVIRRPADPDEERAASKDLDLLGKPALDEYGDGLGRIVDVDFDPATGEITAVITDREEIRGAALVGLGGYAAIFAGERRAG